MLIGAYGYQERLMNLEFVRIKLVLCVLDVNVFHNLVGESYHRYGPVRVQAKLTFSVYI